jgi:hypothetical protein
MFHALGLGALVAHCIYADEKEASAVALDLLARSADNCRAHPREREGG